MDYDSYIEWIIEQPKEMTNQLFYDGYSQGTKEIIEIISEAIEKIKK